MDQQASAPKPSSSAEGSGGLDAAEAVVPDVTSLSLLELFHEPGSALAESMRRLVTEVDHRQATVSSFGSFLS